jgi:hypothetical protein
MARCLFCDQKNPPGAARCAGCGADLPVDDSPDASAGSAPAGRDPSEPADSLERQILNTLATSGKIAAIKEYREATGAGLKESKDAVEVLAARHGVQPARGTGCAGNAVLLTIIATAAWRALI